MEDAKFLAYLDTVMDPALYASQDEAEQERRRIYLTPRHALQQLGTEWGRGCYRDTWIDIALRTAEELLSDHDQMVSAHCPHIGYTPQKGLIEGFFLPFVNGVVIPDVRFMNEVKAIHKAGGCVARLYRPEVETKEAISFHCSEQELLAIPDEEFDSVMINNKGLEDLELLTEITYLQLEAHRHHE